MIIKRFDNSVYYLLFDRATGLAIRKGFHNTEPHINVDGPELIDISITNYCEKGCQFCYRASNKYGKHMPLEYYTSIIKQVAANSVIQVAIGGGNPNQHPQFIDFLRISFEHGIGPSYTTNGHGLSDDIIQASAKYCGAVAVSWYEPDEHVLTSVERLTCHGIKTNIHFMLNANTINKAIYLLDHYQQYLFGINAIVFLNYKPVNGNHSLPLRNSPLLHAFFKRIFLAYPFKIGFDSCTISFLADYSDMFSSDTIDYCEAGRFSCFISEEYKMYPCSFMVNGFDGVNLHEYSITEAWKNSLCFNEFRNKASESRCINCTSYELCHGGCPIFDINSTCKYG